MRADIRAELDRIKSTHHGRLLEPKKIVQAARSAKSPLHNCFTWDKDQAHSKYLLYEARQLIAQYSIVVVKDNGKPIQYRNFVSLTTDRGTGGYREMSDIISDYSLSEQMLQDAIAELERFRAKYRDLKALIPIFQAMDEVQGKRKAA